MNVNGKMILLKLLQEQGDVEIENGGAGKFKEIWCIITTFINATMYP
jgi:hypothetical protein